MQSSHLVTALIAAVLVGGGVWMGATFFGGGADEAAPVTVAERPVVPPPPPAAVPTPVPPPTLGGPGLDVLERRLEDIERRLAAIESAQAEERKRVEPLMRLFDRARESGLIGADGEPVAGAVVEPAGEGLLMGQDAHLGAGFAMALADELGLDPDRKQSMRDAVDRIMDGIETLEKENATVTTAGDTTTIKIGTYDARHLERDWQDWVSRNLSADEQAKVEREHAANRIFGSRLGGRAREIRVKESGGMVEVSESAGQGEQGVVEMQLQGPALAREHILAPYQHLLDD